jgi:hypothetical protein
MVYRLGRCLTLVENRSTGQNGFSNSTGVRRSCLRVWKNCIVKLNWHLIRTAFLNSGVYMPYPQRFALLFRCAQIFKLLKSARLRGKIPAVRQTCFIAPHNTHSRKMLVLAGCVQPMLAPAINT